MLKKVVIAKKVVQVVLIQMWLLQKDILMLTNFHKIYHLGIILSDISREDIVKNSKD